MPKRGTLRTLEMPEISHRTKRRKFFEQKGNCWGPNGWNPVWCKAMTRKSTQLPRARISIIPWTHRLRDRTKRSSSPHTGKTTSLLNWLRIRARPRSPTRVGSTKLKSRRYCHFRSRGARGSIRTPSHRSRGSSRTYHNRVRSTTRTEPLSAWSCQPSDAKRSWRPSKTKRCLTSRRRRTFSAPMVDTLRANSQSLRNPLLPARLTLALRWRRGTATSRLPRRSSRITGPAKPTSWCWTTSRYIKKMRKERWSKRCPCSAHSHQSSQQNPPRRDSTPPGPKESTSSSNRKTGTPSIPKIKKPKGQSASSNTPRSRKATQKLSKLANMPETSSTTSKVISTSSSMVTSHRRDRLSNLRR